MQKQFCRFVTMILFVVPLGIALVMFPLPMLAQTQPKPGTTIVQPVQIAAPAAAGTATPVASMLEAEKLIREIGGQQVEIAKGQLEIEQRLAELEESLRIAVIYVSRTGKN